MAKATSKHWSVLSRAAVPSHCFYYAPFFEITAVTAVMYRINWTMVLFLITLNEDVHSHKYHALSLFFLFKNSLIHNGVL